MSSFQLNLVELSIEVLEEILEEANKKAADAFGLEQSNRYLQNQLTIINVVEREILKRKLEAQK